MGRNSWWLQLLKRQILKFLPQVIQGPKVPQSKTIPQYASVAVSILLLVVTSKGTDHGSLSLRNRNTRFGVLIEGYLSSASLPMANQAFNCKL